MADEQTTVMADDEDGAMLDESDAGKLPDLCPGMAGICYNMQQTDSQHHKLNGLWEGLGTVQTAPPHAHLGSTHPQSQARDQTNPSLNDFYPMPSHKSSCKVPEDNQFQVWFSQQMLSSYESQEKPKTCKNAYTTQQMLGTNPSQVSYRSQTMPATDSSHVTFRPETTSMDGGHMTFRTQTPSPTEAGHVNYRCNTPDLLMSVLQFENQGQNNRGSSMWCTPANSPATSPWPSPDSHHQDSGYYSEEPSPQYYYHPQTSEACSSTSMKIPSFIPTFLPNSNSWNWFLQNTMNQKRTGSIKDINPPKIQRLVKGDLRSPSPNTVIQMEQVSTSQVYKSPVPCNLLPSEQNISGMVQSIHISSADGPSISNTVTPLKQFETMANSLRPNTLGQKRKLTPAKPSKETLLPKKKSRHNEPLNNKAVLVMMRWYEENWENPYPTKCQKEHIAKEGGISVTQVKSWFANKRNRTNNTRPKVQKKQMEDKLLDLCHTLAKDSKELSSNNAYIIDQLSSIINSHQSSSDVQS